jgi:hypothetical protein
MPCSPDDSGELPDDDDELLVIDLATELAPVSVDGVAGPRGVALVGG